MGVYVVMPLSEVETCGVLMLYVDGTQMRYVRKRREKCHPFLIIKRGVGSDFASGPRHLDDEALKRL